jgi:hypothetical protein
MREYVVLLVQPVDARAVRAANAFASTSESAAGASDCPPSAWPQTATMISQASSSALAGTARAAERGRHGGALRSAAVVEGARANRDCQAPGGAVAWRDDTNGFRN